ncbi:MAG: hypothetical protein ACI9D0_001033 [Bacteroidia bacterium]|jgi:hypothetical protein
MIERIEGLPAGVVGLRATGEVTKQDYELAVVPLFDALRAEGEPIRLLFHFPENFRSFTAGAAWEDMKIGLRNMRLIERCAVVSDTNWLRNATRAMGIVAPTRMRTYDEDDMDEALAWLGAKGETSTLTHQRLQNRGVLVLEPNDELHIEDFDHMASLVDPWIEQGDLAGIVIHSERFPGWEDLAGLLTHLKFVRDHHKKVPRVALAIDGAMGKAGPALAKHFLKAEIRHFGYDQLHEAIEWASGDDLKVLGEQIGLERSKPVAT